MIFVLLINCGRETRTNTFGSDSLRSLIVEDKVSSKIRTIEIICDSVYDNKNYKLVVLVFDTVNDDESISNSILTVSQLVEGSYSEILTDSIYSTVQQIKFDDYDNDGIRDILVQHTSDARSNWTYYLYLVDTTDDQLRNIKGFEEIKNPRFITKYNLIDNYVNSGRNWTQFHKINGDSILNYGLTIYDGEDDDGNVTYDDEHKKAVKNILKGERL